MRRTLRRNQATTRPSSSSTRLSSPRPYVICSLRFHVKPPLSRRTSLQFNLLSPLHYCSTQLLSWVYKRRIYYDGYSQITMAIAIRPLQVRVTSDDAYLNELKPSDVLLQYPFYYSKGFYCGRRTYGIYTTNWPDVSIPFRHFENSLIHACILLSMRIWHFSVFCGQLSWDVSGILIGPLA